MAASTITRTSFTDDTGDSVSGDVWNSTLIGTSLYDPIDALFAASLQIEASVGTLSFTINNTQADGDAVLVFQNSGTAVFSMGFDDGDGDKFKLGTTDIGANTRFTIDSSGLIGFGTSAPVTLLHLSQIDSTRLRLATTKNDGIWMEGVNDFGKIEFFSADVSGPGAGIRASILAEPETSAGSTTFMALSVADASTNDVEVMRLKGSTGNVGFGTVSPAGQVHVDQASTSAAKPVMVLDQADVDEDYFKFIGTSDTSADRALVDAANFTTPGAIVGWLKINVQDDQGSSPIADGDYYLPFYAVPTA